MPYLKGSVGALIIALLLTLVSCGAFNEANNYKTPDPSNNAKLHWVRLDTPSNYETIIYACLGTDAIFIGQSSGMTVSTYDPNCGATSQLVGK